MFSRKYRDIVVSAFSKSMHNTIKMFILLSLLVFFLCKGETFKLLKQSNDGWQKIYLCFNNNILKFGIVCLTYNNYLLLL